ncbi:MAG: hypothetical protein ACLPKE_31870 [Streptosporangiaceae bacterium]
MRTSERMSGARHVTAGQRRHVSRREAAQVIGPSGPSVAACADAPLACVSLKGVFAMGMAPAEPAELTVSTSAPPSTLLLSTTMNMPGVEKLEPLATARLTAPWAFTPAVVVLCAVRFSW